MDSKDADAAPEPARQIPPQLTPWTTERAREAGRKSGQVRRARKAAQSRTAKQLAGHLTTLRTTFQGQDLVETITVVLNAVLARLAAGEIPVRHAGDAAELVRALHEVARLEAGQPTSIAASVRVDGDAVLDRLAALQSTARATLGVLDPVPASAAVSAADDDVVDAVLDASPDADVEPVVEPVPVPPVELVGGGGQTGRPMSETDDDA